MTQDRETARRIAQAVRPLGGSVYYVGGCVRDRPSTIWGTFWREHKSRGPWPRLFSQGGENA